MCLFTWRVYVCYHCFWSWPEARKTQRAVNQIPPGSLIGDPLKSSLHICILLSEALALCRITWAAIRWQLGFQSFCWARNPIPPPPRTFIPNAATRQCHANFLVHTDVSTHVLKLPHGRHHGLAIKVTKDERRPFCIPLSKNPLH